MLRNALYATIAALVIAIPLTAVWGQSVRRQPTPTLGERLGNLGRELFGPVDDRSFEADPFAPPGEERRAQTPPRYAPQPRAPERVAANPTNLPRKPMKVTSRNLPIPESTATFDTTGSSRRQQSGVAEASAVPESRSTAAIPRRDSRGNFAAADEQPRESQPSQITKRRRTYETTPRSPYVDQQQPQPSYAQAPVQVEPVAPSQTKVVPKRTYAGRGYAPELARGHKPSRAPRMDHEEPTSIHVPTPARTMGEPTLAQDMQTGRTLPGGEEGAGPRIVRNRHVEQPRAGSITNTQPVMNDEQTPRLARSQPLVDVQTDGDVESQGEYQARQNSMAPANVAEEAHIAATNEEMAAMSAEQPEVEESREETMPDAVATDLGAEGRTLTERLAAARSFTAPKHPLRDPAAKKPAAPSTPTAPSAPDPDAQEIAAEVETSGAIPAAATSDMLDEPAAPIEESQPLVGIPRKVTQTPAGDAPPTGRPTPAVPVEATVETEAAEIVAEEPSQAPTLATTDARQSGEPTPAREPAPHVAKAESPSVQPPSANNESRVPMGDSVLLAKQSPVLSVETIGPRNIKVGTPARYRVVVENAGKVAAEGVLVNVLLPEWADVVGANASTGTARAVENENFGVEWRVGRVESAGRQQLTLEITARRSEPLELDVRWSLAPVKSQTRVVVQEPKLEMRLDGPDEVNYGEEQRFRLEVTNPGNGDAEEVLVRLLPANADEEATEQAIGTVAAGETKTIDLELSALRSGTFWIKAEADAQGGLHSSVAAEVLVRRASLEVAMEGPAFQYAGTEGTYRIRLTNTGNAAARNVEVRTLLPAGVQNVERTETSCVEAANGRVVWALASLAAGEEREFELVCKLTEPGMLRPQVVCTAEDDLTASHGVETKVEALADLSLEIRDPRGPVPVGSEARYEVRIKNRGTSAAHDIDVAAFFAAGVEPLKATGGEHRLAEGQVMFDKIAQLDAGQEQVLAIIAEASVSGNRAFRVELTCPELETSLAAEESTHFYDRRAGKSASVAPLEEPAAVEASTEAVAEPTPAVEPVTAAEPTPADASSEEPTPAEPVESEAPAQP